MLCEDAGYYDGSKVSRPTGSPEVRREADDNPADQVNAEVEAAISKAKDNVVKAVTSTTSDYPDGYGWGV